MSRGSSLSRRRLLGGIAILAGLGGAAFMLRHRIRSRLSLWTRLDSFSRTPELLPHDPTRDAATLYVAQGGTPTENIDTVLEKLGGISAVVGARDVVIIKVSAQWWNQGMTNVAAVKRTIEHVLESPNFAGDIIVFENTHFRMHDGSGLSRAWVKESERNVDVPGWQSLGDLKTHFESSGAPVSFVGLVDGGPSALAGDAWHDEAHECGTYGGDERGPIAHGEGRDGYFWDLSNVFRRKRSWVDSAQTPTTWPRFTCPRTGLVVDLRDGVFTRRGETLVPEHRKLTWINMTTANEHAATGFTGACKSVMGVVDMSAGRLGTDSRVEHFQSTHYFGAPEALWRMAGPLAHFATHVRKSDLIVLVAHWVGAVPAQGWDGTEDVRLANASAHEMRTIVVGTDPVAIDAWAVRHLLMPIAGENKQHYDLDDAEAKVVKFLRYYREVAGSGTLDESLVTVV